MPGGSRGRRSRAPNDDEGDRFLPRLRRRRASSEILRLHGFEKFPACNPPLPSRRCTVLAPGIAMRHPQWLGLTFPGAAGSGRGPRKQLGSCARERTELSKHLPSSPSSASSSASAVASSTAANRKNSTSSFSPLSLPPRSLHRDPSRSSNHPKKNHSKPPPKRTATSTRPTAPRSSPLPRPAPSAGTRPTSPAPPSSPGGTTSSSPVDRRGAERARPRWSL